MEERSRISLFELLKLPLSDIGGGGINMIKVKRCTLPSYIPYRLGGFELR